MKLKKYIMIFALAGCMALQTGCGTTEKEAAETALQTTHGTLEEDSADTVSTESEEKTVSPSKEEKEETKQNRDSLEEDGSKEEELQEKEKDESLATEEDEVLTDEPQIDREDIQPLEKEVTLYAKQKVNVRKGPSTEFDVVGMLQQNDEAVVIGESKSSKWKEIRFGTETAFVHGGYLAEEKVDLEALKAEQEAAKAAAEQQNEQPAAQPAATQQPAAQPTANPQPPAAQPEVASPAGILFIGDSRTCQMKAATGGANCSWICEYGQKYEWFETKAVPEADKLIGQGTKVVICMGVNDPNHCNSYASLVNRKAGDWNARGARVYFVSLNPTAQPYEDKNVQIDAFNATMPGLLSGVQWIDTASTVKQGGYVLVDGIHYDATGNVNIFNLICGSL